MLQELLGRGPLRNHRIGNISINEHSES
jgi:hypothetical protein